MNADRDVPDIRVLLVVGVLAAGAGWLAASGHSATFDETSHLAAGMEWLAAGEFRYEAKHPPLGRATGALGPWMLGVRPAGEPTIAREGWQLLHQTGDPVRVLLSARAGMALWLAAIVTLVGWWAWTLGGRVAGISAAGFAATSPLLLGHGVLVTTDAAGTMGLLLSCFLADGAARAPTPKSMALAGVGAAIALTTKMSAILLMPVGMAVVLLLALADRPSGERVAHFKRGLALVPIALLSMAGVILVIYRFRFGSLADPAFAPYESIESRFGNGTALSALLSSLVSTPWVPAYEFFLGVLEALRHGGGGHRSFFLGEVGENGWPHFFPVVLAAKTPLLVLACAAIAVALRPTLRQGVGRWQSFIVLGLGAAWLAVMIPQRVNIGSRHVLVLSATFAMLAGQGAAALAARLRDRIRLGFLAGVTTAQLSCVALGAPDFVGWFNGLVRHPEDVAVFSDLAWGQDFRRLTDTLKARGASSVALATGMNVPAEWLAREGMPSPRHLSPMHPDTGWIAADWFALRIGSNADRRPGPAAFAWLLAERPVARIGRSMLLYRVESRVDVPTSSPPQDFLTPDSAVVYYMRRRAW